MFLPETNVAFETYVLTRFQCCSLKMFPSNSKQTTMTDGEVGVGEKGKKERNRKDDEKELLIASSAGSS